MKKGKFKLFLLFEIFSTLLSIVFLFSLSLFLILLSINIKNLPSPEILTKNLGGSTQIFDRTGTILLYEIGIRRYWADYNEFGRNIIYATLAAEDDSFFEHKGVSIKGILRSLWLNIKTGGLTYGGSTITQQLARNLFLTQDKSIIRKIKEIILALELERKFSKEEILS